MHSTATAVLQILLPFPLNSFISTASWLARVCNMGCKSKAGQKAAA